MNIYEDSSKNRFNFKKTRTKRNEYIYNINNTNKTLLFNTEREENKQSVNYRNFHGLNRINAKMFKNALKSLRNSSSSQTNFISNDFDFSNISNVNNKYIFSSNKKETENTKFNKTKNKMNQTESLLSTKTSQNHNKYFNSSLDNFYHQVSNKKKRNIVSSLTKMNLTKISFYLAKNKKKNNKNINNITKYDKKEKEENKKEKEKEKISDKGIKEDKKVNIGIDVKENINDEEYIVNSSGFNSYNQIILKNLFQKNKIKIKQDVLDRIILDYNLQNKNIFLTPFYNSFGLMIEDVSQRVRFMKGSLDLIYPKIIQKKYQIKAEQSIKKLGKLRSSSVENIKRNKNDIKDILFSINKYKKISQSVFSKYPIYIKLKGKFSPRMYSFKEQNLLSHKLNKRNLFLK